MTKTILKIFIITAVLTVAAACSKHTVEPPQRPSSEPDISSELLDASTRIDGPLLTLRYDDGGILFSRSSDGVISGVRLNDGIEFEYDPAAPLLKINGVTAELHSARLVQRKDGVEWHQLTRSDRKTDIFIVSDL